MPRFRARDLVVETKPDLTPVTEADRAAESMLRARIEAEHPRGPRLVDTGGDAIDSSGRRSMIVNLGRAPNTEALLESARNLVVGNAQGRAILLHQIASVNFAPRAKVGDAGFMGKPAVVLFVMRQPGVNTLDLSRTVKQSLAELQPFLPQGIHIEILLRQAMYIERSIANLTEVVLEAIAIVAILLFAFLLNVRTTAISLAAIPISLLITMMVFWLLGMSINTMTLGGLAIAVGELVDDAVVGVENIYRRLREQNYFATVATANTVSKLQSGQ